MISIAIMQPTYLPWIGYLALMDRVDHFVFLDDVQFDRRSWQQRNQIKTANGPLWLTVPVKSKGQREQLLMDVEIDRENNFPKKHMATIELNYKKSAYYVNYAPELPKIFAHIEDGLCSLNIRLIGYFKEILGIKTQIHKSSVLELPGAKAEKLAAICEALGASHYLSPPGSKDYIDQSDAFARRNINVEYHAYNHPEYTQQFGDFLPYMSFIDLLFNEGPKSYDIMRRGINS